MSVVVAVVVAVVVCKACFVKESDLLEAKVGLVFSSVFCSGWE